MTSLVDDPMQTYTTSSRRHAVLPVFITAAVLLACTPWLLAVDSSMAAILLGLLVVLSAHGAARAVAAGHHVLQLLFWTFCLSYLVVPAVYQVSHRQAAWGDHFIYENENRLVISLLILNVAFVAFHLGASRPAVGTGAARLTGRSVASLTMPAIYCGLSLALLPLVVSKLSGFSALFSSRGERGGRLAAEGISQTQSGGAAVALYGILPGSLALAAAYVLLLRWRRGSPAAAPLLFVASVLVLLYANPLANSRYVSFIALVSLMLVVWQPRSPAKLAAVSLALVVGMLGVYPLANTFRSPDREAETVSLADNDFDGFQQIVNTQQFVEEKGHTLGVQLGSAALFFLPRRFWEEKAVPASIPVAENRGYAFTNLSLPLPGELYLEFGFIGTVAGMFGWGLLWRRLDEQWGARADTVGAELVPYLAIAQVGLLRGPAGSLVPIYATTTMLVIFALRSRAATDDHGSQEITDSSQTTGQPEFTSRPGAAGSEPGWSP